MCVAGIACSAEGKATIATKNIRMCVAAIACSAAGKATIAMKHILMCMAIIACSVRATAQFNFTPVTQLLTDSIGVIGQAGQNCSFMIVQGDSVIYERYWGSWNANTYQPIASGSKMASMALIMRLIDEGYLSPDDTVQHFLPSFSGKPIITLRQLMNHTSGLPGISPYISGNSYNLQQAVDSIGLNTPMTSNTPGSAFLYGGVSMHVAGRMAEIATGMRWDSLFQQKMAAPLGMTNTNYVGTGATTNFRIAGGMGTTMRDFSRLLIMLLQYGRFNNLQVLDSLTVKMMQSDQTNGVPLTSSPYANDPLRQGLRYGYGVWVEQETNGETTQFGSQGAFGFTPWVDRCRNIACVLFVRRTLGIVQPTHTRLRSLIEQIIPSKLQQPMITVNGVQLHSSYTAGNQWFFNDTLLTAETGQFIVPAQNGIYSVKHTSEEGCEIFSNDFNVAYILPDEDGDGFSAETDCDDNNPAIFPGASEACDGLDNNCDGLVDEGLSIFTFFRDADGDGFGDPADARLSCDDAPPAGFVLTGADCDDNNPAIFPGAAEACDGLDNNCDGMVDEGLSIFTFFRDADGDGFGDPAQPLDTCLTEAPAPYVSNPQDCDDSNAAVNPGQPELPDDQLDNDCDGETDNITATTDLQQHLRAYPNPVYDWLVVASTLQGAVRYEIISISGQLLRSGEAVATDGQLRIPFDRQLPGVYILRLQETSGAAMGLLRVVKCGYP